MSKLNYSFGWSLVSILLEEKFRSNEICITLKCAIYGKIHRQKYMINFTYFYWLWGNSSNFSCIHVLTYIVFNPKLHKIYENSSLSNMYIAMCPIFHINHIFTDWKVDGHQQLSWVTQTCATKVEGRVGCLLYL